MTPIDTMPMMKCGCRAMSFGRQAGETEADMRPSCIIHSCFEVDDAAPDMTGRKARCAYYGKPQRKSECNYGQSHEAICTCEQPSDGPMLPFFKYLGPQSPTSVEMCKCGFHTVAHLPYWTAAIQVERNWYKCGRITEVMKKSFHASESDKETKAEWEADFFRSQTYREESKVFSATVLKIVPAQSSMKCRTFRPVGPAAFDEFYCGCHGWD